MHSVNQHMAPDMTTLDLVEHIYAAVTNPELWAEFLAQFQKQSTCCHVGLLITDGSFTPITHKAIGIDPAIERNYVQFAEFDPHTRPNTAFTNGICYDQRTYVADREFMRSPYYSEYLRQTDIFYSAGGRVLASAALNAFMCLSVPRNAGAVATADVDQLQLLMPHLQRAICLQQKFAQAEATRETMPHLLDAWVNGAALLDWEGRLLLTNRRIEAIFDKEDGIGRRGNRLHFSHRATHVWLGKALMQFRHRAEPAMGDATLVPRTSGQPPYQMALAPIPLLEKRFDVPRAEVLLLVNSPDEKGDLRIGVAARLYGFTPTERTVAALMVEGASTENIGDVLGISRSTVTTHIKHLFGKTGTGRQAELVRLLLGVPALMPADASPRPDIAKLLSDRH